MNKLKVIFNLLIGNIKTYISYILIAIVLSLSAYGVYLYKENIKLKNEVTLNLNNIDSYKNIISRNVNENSVLRLKLGDLSHSNDSLIQGITKVQKVLKIKDKELSEAYAIAQKIDTVFSDTIKLPSKCNFDKTLMLNNETKSRIILKDSLLENHITITDTLNIFDYARKVYVNMYKSFFSRLFHFDFKKTTLDRYAIKHSNDILKNQNVRVVRKED
jgi:hypothetical protein